MSVPQPRIIGVYLGSRIKQDGFCLLWQPGKRLAAEQDLSAVDIEETPPLHKGFRNIYFGSGAPGSSLGANGDVYINIG